LLGLLWLGWNGADVRSWIIGGPVVLVAAWLSVRLMPGPGGPWRLRGLPAFVWFFVRESLRGGFDVAWRSLGLKQRLQPAMVTFAPRLPAGAARWLFCGCVSLLPGTCVVRIEAATLHIHVLDCRGAWQAELRALEQRVGALFGVASPPGELAPSA